MGESGCGDVPPGRATSVRGVLGETWHRSGGWSGSVSAAAPTVVFAATSALVGLVAAAVGAAAAAAAAAFTVQVARGGSLRGAAAGLVLAVGCALVAVGTGQARGFFLLSTAVPIMITLACLGTLGARRPLTGLVVNPVAGGPAAWRRDRRLLRIYDVTTLIVLAFSVLNAALRVVLYVADRTGALAAVYTLTGPLFVVLAAGTLVAVRRHLARIEAT